MGSKADHDLWGQALAFERRYGDRGPAVIAEKIQALRDAAENHEAEFWSQVADCLNDLHAIRYLDGGKPAKPAGAIAPRSGGDGDRANSA